jgi:hypothetical protein
MICLSIKLPKSAQGDLVARLVINRSQMQTLYNNVGKQHKERSKRWYRGWLMEVFEESQKGIEITKEHETKLRYLL